MAPVMPYPMVLCRPPIASVKPPDSALWWLPATILPQILERSSSARFGLGTGRKPTIKFAATAGIDPMTSAGHTPAGFGAVPCELIKQLTQLLNIRFPLVGHPNPIT
jgi:hypothetical protein